ncbi:glycosyltransferase family 2 protein [Pseudonocardia sp. KRD-184]|uniref:Glycosyltransferase family 2 protein n=1 Tax=Pseudonocardia oceani TaxID=2792013 RepID=A0ABS6U5J2_9PSEU|nr:glycosyltransferase [Pseudonocardia oceani]MBW0091339.1 glycosyltransferase family 2 protein [Pseudonocardia oceani]MBW0098418.1 glycosyltransferase family 2 protein [Pseudonocardia oceani]MBW0125001.1 glycosyltransferase family 2 protein [Pseudonocardia oceani]MBW0127492.1 glycosyltransferase family 2 protein [Pseudonocardia oceani]
MIITYRSVDVIGALASSCDEWLREHSNARLVVLDNSSCQETIDAVRSATQENRDQVIAAVNGSNTGFAPAVNAAVEQAAARWGRPGTVMLLNPDVMTDVEVLSHVPGLLNDPTIGVAAPLLLEAEGHHADRGVARRFWNRRLLFAEIVGAPRMAALFASRPRNFAVRRGTGLVDVDITSGAFMAIRAEVFGAGLDTRLPMYLEDQEVCHRAAQKGLRVVVDQDVVARHVGGASRQSNTAMTRQLRMMELASAPCLSLNDTAGHSISQLRVLVGVAGGIRLMTAGAVRCTIGAMSARARRWARDQMVLGGWFVRWARDRSGVDGAALWRG